MFKNFLRRHKEVHHGCRLILGKERVCGLWWNNAVFQDEASIILSALLFIVGIPWVVWAVLWQLWKGKGTPVPAVPTKNFLQSGPYHYCRNPMMLGLTTGAAASLATFFLATFFLYL